MSTTAGRWASATGSVRGASHARNGRPNQDAVRVVPVSGAVPGIVAAVCDGHGGDRYVRSDVGSRIAVEVACAVGKRALADLGPHAESDDVRTYLAQSVSSAIVAQWRDRVLDDVARRAFTDDERRTAGAPLDSDPLVAYGCTLVLAVFGPEWVGLLQIGDGDVTVVRGSDVSAPVPTDERLIGSETTSLCLPSAESDARVAALAEPLPDLVVLTSDGYANSFASPTWRNEIGLDLRDHVARLGIDGVEQRLPAWLDDSATAGGDDVSMALVHRRDAPTAVAAGTVPATTQETRNHARSGAQARRTGPGLVAGVAAVAALTGIGVGWAFTRTDGSSEGVPSSTLSATTPPSTATLDTLPTPTSAEAPLEPGTTPPGGTLLPDSTPSDTRPPDTGPPDTLPAESVPRDLVPSEDVYLLLTAGAPGIGVLIDVDATGDPRLLEVVEELQTTYPAPSGWQPDPGSGTLALTTESNPQPTCIAVLAFRVLRDRGQWLAVSADGSRLLLVDTASGDILLDRPIAGSEQLAPYARDADADTCPATESPTPAPQNTDAAAPGQETAADGGGQGGG